MVRLACMDDLLDSAWLKWAWAVVDAQALQEDVNAFALDTNAEATADVNQHYDAKRRAVVLSVAKLLHPFPDRWGLRFGDVVHNYRSCLDHLAWALVQRGLTSVLTERQKRGVYFPIAMTRTQFNASIGRRLPGVLRADIAKVRRHQPYHQGQRNRARHVLTVLDELSRHDKHRTIQPVVGTPDTATYRLKAAHDCEVIRLRRKSMREPVQVGTEIGVFYVRRTGLHPKIDMEGDLPLYPAVNATLRLEKWMELTMKVTFRLLSDFAEPPPVVRDVLVHAGVVGSDDPWEVRPVTHESIPPVKG